VLPSTQTVSIIELREDISAGQSISSYELTSEGRVLASGTTIGYKRLVRVAPTAVRTLTLTTTSLTSGPVRARVRTFKGSDPSK
jgi:hypothetical protein